jgi:hypothetical protein
MQTILADTAVEFRLPARSRKGPQAHRCGEFAFDCGKNRTTHTGVGADSP